MRRKWYERFGRLPVLLLAAVLLPVLLAAGGCGKKGPPKLPEVAAPVGVQDLAAAAEGETIVLTWTAPPADAPPVAGYFIYRSAEPVGVACPGCPVLFRRTAEVPLSGERATYREPLLPGTRYHFKVVPYDAQGRPGPDSNVVRLVTE